MIINLVPLGFTNENLLKKIITILSHIFTEVKIFSPIINLEDAYTIERGQYYSTKIIESYIKEDRGTKEDYFLILTDYDIYIPALTYVFGEAQLKGKYSIVSAFRLHEEFYTGETDEKLLSKRIIKEIMHELGHNFGLIHCIDWDCVMHSSNGIEEVDIKSHYYCKSCFNELKRNEIIIPEYILL